jgi:mRNA-degrading endonuclease RelE of RelBE toxin-antitoxin system
MTPGTFSVFTTSRFDREYKKLRAYHPELPEHYAGILAILQTDPYNHTGFHPIKKVIGVPPGEGQWRIRAERFRFRYDIEGQRIYLKACSLRDEHTYRR